MAAWIGNQSDPSAILLVVGTFLWRHRRENVCHNTLTSAAAVLLVVQMYTGRAGNKGGATVGVGQSWV